MYTILGEHWNQPQEPDEQVLDRAAYGRLQQLLRPLVSTCFTELKPGFESVMPN